MFLLRSAPGADVSERPFYFPLLHRARWIDLGGFVLVLVEELSAVGQWITCRHTLNPGPDPVPA